MARRKAPAAPAAADPGVFPERLAVCWVEDWVQPGERPSDRVCNRSTINGVAVDDIPGQVTFYLEMRALRRWQAARDAWGAEHGLSRREMTVRHGTSAPRWRVPPAP